MKRKLFALLLTLAMMLGAAHAVSAAGSVVTFAAEGGGFDFAPGSDYTNTDLFGSLKGCMPGDVLTETITIKNESTGSNMVRVTLRADVAEPTYSESYEAEDGNDQAGVEGVRDEDAASMQDFLSQLQLRIYNGSELLYEGDAAGSGALQSGVRLGDVNSGSELQVTVELTVPASLGNEYANRVGEVQWIFHGEVFEYKSLTLVKLWEGDRASARPSSITVDLLADGQLSQTVTLTAANNWVYTWPRLDDRYFWTVREHAVNGYTPLYVYNEDAVAIINTAGLIHTGQLNWPVPVLGGLGALLLLLGVVLTRRGKEENA